jgi:hypothetical protein
MFSNPIFKSFKKQNEEKTKNIFLIYWYTLQQYVEFCINYFLKTKMQQKVKKVSHGKIEVNYQYCGKDYSILINAPRGPLLSSRKRVKKILNDQGEDITAKILPYLGPNCDWHNIAYQCCDFNAKHLSFTFDDDTIVVKNNNDLLDFS